MKKLITTIFCALTLQFSVAQIDTPAPSPAAKIEQKVGLTDMTVSYSRPGIKGRTIFGDLVPYGKLWRTGANKNTEITFSDDVIINKKEVKAGSYAIFTKPSATSWEVYFYADTNNWGTPQKWDESKVVAKVVAPIEKLPFKIETFTILISNIKDDKAVLEFLWENALVEVPIEVPTDKKAMASIEKVMGGPAAPDYFAAARYYMNADKDINKAKQFIDKAVEKTKDQPRFWYLRLQSQIYAKAGQKKQAIGIAKQSMKLAEKAGNADYVKMNKEAIAKWSR